MNYELNFEEEAFEVYSEFYDPEMDESEYDESEFDESEFDEAEDVFGEAGIVHHPKLGTGRSVPRQDEAEQDEEGELIYHPRFGYGRTAPAGALGQSDFRRGYAHRGARRKGLE